jgi:hypothetical protein
LFGEHRFAGTRRAYHEDIVPYYIPGIRLARRFARLIGYHGGMGKYSVKRLFASVTLIAIGMGNITFIKANGISRLPESNPPDAIFIAAILLMFFPGPLIGAGIFIPWKCGWNGAILGGIIWVALLFTRMVTI